MLRNTIISLIIVVAGCSEPPSVKSPQPEIGGLTFKGHDLVFVSGGVTNTFPLPEYNGIKAYRPTADIPGLRFISSQINDQHTEISVLIFQNVEGESIDLPRGIPVRVSRADTHIKGKQIVKWKKCPTR